MNNKIDAFFITFLAGISTILGMFFTFIPEKKRKVGIPFSLSMTSSVMISISLFSLIPESIKFLPVSNKNIALLHILIFMNIGIIISNTIGKELDKITNKDSLYKLGIISMIALIIHNIPEDCIKYASQEI